jgi:23S rRNA (cytosine1962-C5)-methyltransferase
VAPPWVLHEDDDVLAVDKPSGVSTHQADALGQAGLHEQLSRDRAGALSVLHRLDKETSGVLLLGKTTRANQTLTQAFGARDVEKRYLLLTARPADAPARLTCDDRIRKPKRTRDDDDDGQEATTDFERVERGAGFELVLARPRTGRTHQVRVHAARLGFPILGDGTYGGRGAARLFLHAHGLDAPHPAGARLRVESPLPGSFRAVLDGASPHGPRVAALAGDEARRRVLDPATTDCWLWLDRHHDGVPDRRVERYGSTALVLRYDESGLPLERELVAALLETPGVTGVWEQRRPKGGSAPPATPVAGDAPARSVARELGLSYQLDLAASGTSSGLFLDQRETRRRLLGLDLQGKTLLNAFAHTCALSVAAAKAGAVTTSLDLSRRYLDRGKENLALNGLDPAAHDAIYGDALEWMRRLEKKGRRFDVVLVDPPSYSNLGRGKGTWSVERDLPELVALAARLVGPRGGRLYASTNLRRLPAATFLERVKDGLKAAGRAGEVEFVTLPLDHRSGPGDPPYLKGAWVEL